MNWAAHMNTPQLLQSWQRKVLRRRRSRKWRWPHLPLGEEERPLAPAAAETALCSLRTALQWRWTAARPNGGRSRWERANGVNETTPACMRHDTMATTGPTAGDPTAAAHWIRAAPARPPSRGGCWLQTEAPRQRPLQVADPSHALPWRITPPRRPARAPRRRWSHGAPMYMAPPWRPACAPHLRCPRSAPMYTRYRREGRPRSSPTLTACRTLHLPESLGKKERRTPRYRGDWICRTGPKGSNHIGRRFCPFNQNKKIKIGTGPTFFWYWLHLLLVMVPRSSTSMLVPCIF